MIRFRHLSKCVKNSLFLGFRFFDLDLWLSLNSSVCSSIVGSARKMKRNTTVSHCSEFFYVKCFFCALWCKKRKRRKSTTVLHSTTLHCWLIRYANRANKEIHWAKLFECCVTLFSVDLTPSIFRSSLNILRCFFLSIPFYLSLPASSFVSCLKLCCTYSNSSSSSSIRRFSVCERNFNFPLCKL